MCFSVYSTNLLLSGSRGLLLPTWLLGTQSPPFHITSNRDEGCSHLNSTKALAHWVQECQEMFVIDMTLQGTGGKGERRTVGGGSVRTDVSTPAREQNVRKIYKLNK